MTMKSLPSPPQPTEGRPVTPTAVDTSAHTNRGAVLAVLDIDPETLAQLRKDAIAHNVSYFLTCENDVPCEANAPPSRPGAPRYSILAGHLHYSSVEKWLYASAELRGPKIWSRQSTRIGDYHSIDTHPERVSKCRHYLVARRIQFQLGSKWHEYF